MDPANVPAKFKVRRLYSFLGK